MAGALLAVSPGAVYISRYFIHETLLVAMTLALVVSTLFYVGSGRPATSWRRGLAALLFTTKETAVITIAVLLIAVAVAHVYLRFRDDAVSGCLRPARDDRAAARQLRPSGPSGSTASSTGPPEAAGRRRSWAADFTIPLAQLAIAVAVFAVIYILLFSSFFTNFPQGLVDSFTAYIYWFQHGDATQIQPPYQYLHWAHPADDVLSSLASSAGSSRRSGGRSSLGDRWALGGGDLGGLLADPVQDAMDR